MRYGLIVSGAAALLACGGLQAQSGGRQMPGAIFSELQELDPFTPEQMAERRAKMADDDERIAADAALNDWKLCVIDAVSRWAELQPGPGTIADGAFGRCAGLARDYRTNLVKVKYEGRAVVDVQTARTLWRGLEETWRPRLIAAVLDQELARRSAVRTAIVPPVVTTGTRR